MFFKRKYFSNSPPMNQKHQNNWDTNMLSNIIIQKLIKPLQNDDKSNLEHPSFAIYTNLKKLNECLC